MTIPTALIGCGSISRFHIAGLAKAKAPLRWACDLDATNAATRTAGSGAQVTTDWRQAVRDPEVRLVVVATSAAAHREVCLEAIALGKAVVCEKTLGTTPDEAWDIVQAAQRAGTPFWTSYMKRFLPAVRKAHELLPAIGPVISVHARSWQPWGDLWTTHPAEGLAHCPAGGTSGLVRNYGGAALHCAGSHVVDLILHLAGRPARVSASVYVPPGRDYDLRATALMELPSGASVTFEACAHPLKSVGIHRNGWDEKVEINGTRGRLTVYTPTWDRGEQQPSVLVHEDNEVGATEHRFAPMVAFDDAVGHFVACAARGEQGPQSKLTGYEADELIAAILRAGRSHSVVEMAWKA